LSTAFFRINGVGEIPSAHAGFVLQRVNSAYCGLWILDQIWRLSPRRLHLVTRNLRLDTEHSIWAPEADLHMTPLQLRRVVLQSPGYWEFLGKLNPLEVIRVYLNDRHARLKDASYRNRLEEEKLTIENNLLKVKLISDLVDAARKAGLSRTEISALIRDNALVPLLRLEALQDKGVISNAEIAQKRTKEVPEEVDA